MAQDWEKQAVVQEFTERITDGEYSGEYEQLKSELENAAILTERDRQQLVQYWLSKERESGRPGN